MSKLQTLVRKAVQSGASAELHKQRAFRALVAQMKWMSMKQKDVAADMGISKAYFCDMVNGNRGYTTDTLAKMLFAITGQESR